MAELQQALMDNKKKSVIHRRKWLTLEEKLKIIEAYESGKTSTNVARELGMNESSVRSILRKKDFYKSLRTSTSIYRLKSFARHRSLVLEKVEKQLINWIEDNNRKRVPLTETEIQRKALAIFGELNKKGECREKFSASQGWFYRFKNRINMHNCVISKEKALPNKAKGEKFRLEFAKIIQDGGYTHHQVFNVEETSLYWKKIPSESFDLERNQTEGYKPFKDSLTLLLGGNAAGDLKLKPMIVYRSETPCALKDCEKDSLPVIWRSNKKAWLTKELFQGWFVDYFCPTVENYCSEKGLEYKILLLLDSAPSHTIGYMNKNIEVVYLPQDTSSFLQPLTLNVFPLFKASYLKLILTQASSSKGKLQEFWSNYNIRQGIDNIYSCWCDIKPEDFAVSWHQLLPDIKIKDFESEIAAVVQDVLAMGQELGFKIKAMKKKAIQNLPEIEEIMFKEEALDIYEDECNQDPSTDELEKIIHNIDAACELIRDCDLDSERSLGIQQILQDGIQPYKDLYNERINKGN